MATYYIIPHSAPRYLGQIHSMDIFVLCTYQYIIHIIMFRVLSSKLACEVCSILPRTGIGEDYRMDIIAKYCNGTHFHFNYY